jgi:hypothetical protein
MMGNFIFTNKTKPMENPEIWALWIGILIAALAVTVVSGIFSYLLFIVGVILIGVFCFQQYNKAVE